MGRGSGKSGVGGGVVRVEWVGGAVRVEWVGGAVGVGRGSGWSG